MTPKRIEREADLNRLIPVHHRHLVKKGADAAMYRVNRPDYDRLPIDTFLLKTMMGTGGKFVEWAGRIVLPNDPSRYPPNKLTAEKRLIYVFWANGEARRALGEPKSDIYRHVICPFDPRHEGVAKFKFACDHVHAGSGRRPFLPTILYQALGFEPLDVGSSDT